MWKMGALVLCVLMTAPRVHAQTEEPISGTWFGAIVLTGPDGKASHDTAVLMVERDGSVLKGSLGRSADEQSPLTELSFHDGRMRFHLDAAGGMNFVLDFKMGRWSGTAEGPRVKATIDLRPAPGLMPHAQMLEEITEADRQLYEAFTGCDVKQYGKFLDKDLEFYQDRTGKTDYEQNLQALRDRCAEGIQLRRELVEGSLIVNAAPGVGAIQAGTQRFYSKQKDGSEHMDATARFTNVWSKATGSWKLVRVISYDHR